MARRLGGRGDGEYCPLTGSLRSPPLPHSVGARSPSWRGAGIAAVAPLPVDRGRGGLLGGEAAVSKPVRGSKDEEGLREGVSAVELRGVAATAVRRRPQQSCNCNNRTLS